MRGRIIRSISGFYDVETECGIRRYRAKGNFRKKGITPLVGDEVRLSDGLIEEILPRRNELVRPNVANVDQIVLVLAAIAPQPGWLLLERTIAMARYHKVKPILVINKEDQLAEDPASEEVREVLASYQKEGLTVCLVSALEDRGMDTLRTLLEGKISVLAGPSGVGKSSLLNRLSATGSQEVGELSEKILRGKNTTRVCELLYLADLDAYVADTPGFTSLQLDIPIAEKLRDLYPEWKRFSERCYYQGCFHENEPDCAVRRAAEDGGLSALRYSHYRHLLGEVREYEKQNPEYTLKEKEEYDEGKNT